ncbi:5'-nucleotidase SurE [Fervidicola ferrireducens]|uniref:5'-nucleotidase SurE n=1 Tax=Fervidicola ferrireducens TaxID=520764 RepID=A0A140L104_9FIRM|nr:5'/3'-nucleotidase SurE [Fervidicola ferrireducens]KXG74229.1 5'-nucleotidase SurE [Fervidicola ferrireducens]
MNILITNDDGIYAEGLLMLAREISKIAKVTVVAPDRERSATAHAITMHKPLRVEKAELRNCSVESWMVNGTPSDCVKLALDALLNDAPDLVLSGINRGPNLGTDVIYSGTVSAAIEAAIYGIPAVAVSVAAYENVSYEYPAQFVRKLCEVLKEKQFPKDTLLNVNIPPLDAEDIAGVLITRLGNRKYKNCFDRRQDPRGKTYYWLAGEVVEDLEDETSDVWAIKNNYISITPIHFDLTNYEVIDSIKKWELKPLL